ncbi:uncharacterized protein EDB91DRAFT_1102256 [Suillus paluster]|uniref:uncharacterized protein n=1 Tax=Suillus paluster TaxID=48578 RepID=UPI001B87CC96|nr:uncharacterized protein EDB91DRAFT_1102256 [Suillus paluster]KAG1752399.1 hypothetical protein EDB91DRAFT_1102256 [Suillus paluster]
MNVLYVSVRYIGILSFVYLPGSVNKCYANKTLSLDSALTLLLGLPSVLVTDVGTVIGLAQRWTIFIVNIMLDEYHASHHNYSVICHVSAIQNDVHLSRCDLPGCHDCLRSDRRSSKQPCFRGGAYPLRHLLVCS